MRIVTLELLKQHVRADDLTCEDVYLTHVLEAAQGQVMDYIGWTEEELSAIPDGEWPAPVRHAVLMRAATMYAYREDVDNASLSPLPFALSALLKPYRKMCGGSVMERIIAKYKTEKEAQE